jgi:DNA-binding response OmpR family regulator
MSYRLLIVDDDMELVKMLKSYFELKNYLISTAMNGKEALERIASGPDLILLDINMPKMDGLEVCKRIRNYVSCPILFLTAKVEEQDRINGLLSGGDDYILKPFSLKELEARITAHLKREERHAGKRKILFSNEVMVDLVSRTVCYQDKEINFTKAEFDIIEFLATHAGQVFDKERIYEKIWGYDGDGDSRVVTELIRRIRKKLSEYTAEELIETVWGCGYQWRK